MPREDQGCGSIGGGREKASMHKRQKTSSLLNFKLEG
jgi:hypothetical protein